MAPYYPFIGSDAAKPVGTTGDFHVATDTAKLSVNVNGTWFEVGAAIEEVTLAGTVAVGDLIGYSSGWVRAANTAGAIIPAQYVAMKAGVSTDTIPVARKAIITGSYTSNAPVYLSTAGATTTTRPTTAASLRQKVGVALSTTEAAIEIRGLREVSVPIVNNGATSAFAILDTGALGGPTLDANTELLALIGIIPENAVSLVIAKLYLAAAASAGTPTMDVTINSHLDGETKAAYANTDLVNLAREDATLVAVQITDITLGFATAGMFRPGAIIGIKCAQDDGGTDQSWVFGGIMVMLVAD